jgi:hypothetical protein
MRRRHIMNHDELRTQHRVCMCGHTRAEHEIHPDEHCYKCECKEFHRCSNYKRMFNCDAFRIVTFPGRMYLILGWKRNTKDDPGQWTKNGEPFDFDYLKEKVVASGRNEAALLKSAKEYKRISGMTSMQYLEELIAKKGKRK